MSQSVWNFTDNLGIQNNRFIKLTDQNLIVRDILGLDTTGNLILNSANRDIYINSNSSGSYTHINKNNTAGVLINSQLGVGISSTSNMVSNIVLPNNGWIGLNTTQGSHTGYLGLAGSSSLENTTGSRVLLFGVNATGGNAGDIQFASGSIGNIKGYIGNSLKFTVLNSGTANFQPDGSTIVMSVSNSTTTITNQVNLSNTTESTNATSGALVIGGGLGIMGNTYIDGNLSINSITGNLNFNSTQISTSYSSGSFFLYGGLGITCSVNSTDQYNGGALSVAGGFALGKNAIFGGNLTILNSNDSIDALSGSCILYGGLGINGQVNIRTSSTSQIKLTPIVTGNETSIYFGYRNNYTSSGSWILGQNTGSIGSGNFGISISGSSFITLNGNNSQIYLNNYTNLSNTFNITSNNKNLITFSSNWSIGQTNGNFQISRSTSGYLLTSDQQTGNITVYGTQNSISNISGGSLTVLGGASIAKDVYIGGNVYGGNINFTGNIVSTSSTDVNTLSYLTITATDQAINLTSGALVIFGGMTIQDTSDSLSVTNGGSFLTAGGGSFGASVHIGNTMSSNTISATNLFVTNNTISNVFSTNINATNSSLTNLISTNASISNCTITFQTIGSLTSTNITASNIVSTNLSSSNILTNSLNSTTANLINISSSNLQVTNTTINNSLLTSVSSSNINTTNITSSTITATSHFNAKFNSNTLGNLFTTNGNIGINTTSPTSLLTINGTGAALIITTNSTTQSTFQEFYSGNSNAVIGIDGIGLAGFNTGSMILGTFADDSIIFMTNTNQVMVIDTSGNVGIGVSNPKFKLDITDSFRVNSNVSVSNTQVNITNTTGSINFTSDLVLSNTSRNSIIFSQAGVSKPSFDTRSLGSKLIVYPNISSNTLDYSVGVETGFLWNSTPGGYKLYTNNTKESLLVNSFGIMTLSSTAVSLNSTSGSINITGGLSIAGTSNSISSTQGGSLTAAGGASIAKDFYLGGSIFNAISATGTLSNLLLSSTTNSLGVGSGGSLTVLGGTTISKDCYIGTVLGIGNTKTITPQQPLEVSVVNYAINQNAGIRISTKDPVSINDNSYRYLDLRLVSDSMTNFRGSIFATLAGGVPSEYEYMSFSQNGYTNVYSQTKFINGTSCSNSSTGSVVFSGGLSINCPTGATNVSNGGALTVAGGVSIAGDLIIGGTISYSNAASASSTFAYLTLTATDSSTDIGYGALVSFGGISIQNTTDATSASSGNGMTVAGGVGIGASLYVHGKSNLLGGIVSTNNSTVNLIANNITSNNLYITNGLRSTFNSNTLGNLFTTNGNIGINTTQPNYLLDVYGITKTTQLYVTNTSGSGLFSVNIANTNGNYSSSAIPGDTILQATGNFILQASSGSTSAIYIATSGNVGINNNNPGFDLDITGIVNIRNTLDSSNSSTGALISNGGISISKTTNATSTALGGALTIAGGMAVFKDVYVGGTLNSSSDNRLKENIKPIQENMLDKIQNIIPIRYNMINDSSKKTHIGFSAQNIETIFPELISKESNESYLALKYDRITSINLKCIQELYNEIKELKIQIKKLNKK